LNHRTRVLYLEALRLRACRQELKSFDSVESQ
jgi:hypothetical protein